MGNRKPRQQAPPPVRPTRKVSDMVLARMLDDHMLDSLSDIGLLYQRLNSLMGYRSFKYEARVQVGRSEHMMDNVIDVSGALHRWKKLCEKNKMRTQVVILIASDGISVKNVMRITRLKMDCVRAHLRGCLGIWSLLSKRCSWLEVQGLKRNILACCGRAKAQAKRQKPVNPRG
jgi:hypothetical protein